MLKLWTSRQAGGKVPFRFRKGAFRKQNPKAGETDADIETGPGSDAEEDSGSDAEEDSGPGNEAEGDMQGDHGAQESEGAPRGEGGGDGPTAQAHPSRGLGDAAENPREVSWLLGQGYSSC